MLKIKPISLKLANEYVMNNHRHHDKVQGHKFSLSVWDEDRLCGVAIVGHPQSRMIDNDNVLEVLRLCTDGTYNACSILYARCARVGKDMGYKKIITYILESECGTSLKASGWHCEEEKCGGFAWGGAERGRKTSVRTNDYVYEREETTTKGIKTEVGKRIDRK